MHKLSLWCLITIHTFSMHASEKSYPEYQNLSLTSILLPKSNHTIDLEYVEPFTKRAIKDFIQEAKETDMPWLLALCHNETNSPRIFNGLHLTAWCMTSNKDPLAKVPITNIDFFKCEHIQEQFNISHVGTYQDVNDPESLLRLLSCYIISNDIEKKNKAALFISNFYSEQGDLPTAIRWCQKAANTGHIDAIAELGYLFKQYGDFDKALFYFKEAAERGDTDSAIHLGHLYAKNGNHQQALHWLEIGADRGVPEAMRLLGNLYYKLRKTAKAIEWLTAGAMHNNPLTIADLAFVYHTTNEFSKALDLYLKAAELNHPTLDLFYTLHLAIGHPIHGNVEKLGIYADMLVDKINQHDQSITSFKAKVPDRYQTSVDMVERYATKSIIHSND